jgi:multidrug efflux pump subunit AcrA (membrane-fusion protein)
MKTLLKFLLPLMVLGAGAALFVSLKASRPPPVALQPVEKQWSIATESVERRGISPLVRLNGRTESPSLASLRAAVEAEVASIRVHEGDAVLRGQLLVELDSSELELLLRQRDAEVRELNARVDSENRRLEADRAALADEQALLELARANLQRAERLASNRAGSEAAVDEALQIIRSRSLAVVQRRLNIDDHPHRLAQLQAAIARAEAARERVQLDIERTRVRAPFDGRILKLAISAGERVRVGDGLLDVFDSTDLEVRAQIPGPHLPAVRRGMEQAQGLTAEFDLEGRRYPLTLARLGAQIAQGRAGLDGFFRFGGDAPPSLEVGRLGELLLSLPVIEDAVSLPVSALYGGDTVYRVVDDRLQSVAVQHLGEHLGSDGESRLVLKSSLLAEGDRVMVSQIPAAVDGLKVASDAP